MDLNRQMREKAMEQVVATERPRWHTLDTQQKFNVAQRVAAGMGITTDAAFQRMLNDPCPKCGSSDTEKIGTTILSCNMCNHRAPQ